VIHHEAVIGQILAKVESGKAASQRSLSRDLGIALGLTNLLMRRMIRKGWVRVTWIRPNRVLYLITPSGLAEKARVSREYFARSVKYYQETRDQIQEAFAALSAEFGNEVEERRRIVFYGAGEAAEIAYVCVQNTGLCLVGVVDERRTNPFFGMPVHPLDRLNGQTLNGHPFDRLVVTFLEGADDARQKLRALGVSPARTFWLWGGVRPTFDRENLASRVADSPAAR
jgi:DNA-binding PadR family transcriptional regulator